MQITINPADEKPSTLRAIALMLSSIASDRDGGKPVTQIVAPDGSTASAAVQSPKPEANPGNAHDAPGASDQSQIPPPPPLTGATAQTDSTGSDNSELDVNSLPWIAEIHSTSKNKNQDGTWRYIRGGDPQVRAQVEARVRAEMAAKSSVQQPGGEADGEDTPPPPPPPVVQQQQETPPPPPPPPLENAAPAPTENPDLLKQQAFKRLSSLTPEQRTEALGLVGMGTPADFLKEVKVRPELAAELIDAIVALTGEE